ncbi:MAG: acyl-CoA dehydrogenase family protein [Alphaproteobacteria bacterium]|nr:acyl-CoA dehydrogenase family protein [Alphaproteobacteria bacterium]
MDQAVSTFNIDSIDGKSPFLTDTHLAWRDQLRRFIKAELEPHIEEWEDAGEIPRELHKTAADFGLLQLGYPEEYGGISEGIDGFHKMITSDELGRMGAGGVYTGLLIHGIGLPPVLAGGSEELKQRIAPAVLSGEKIIALGITEPSGGSDVANLQTRARREGDHYIVNGQKMFISAGMRADYLSAAVRTGGPGIGGISMMVIDMNQDGVSRTLLRKQGWHSSDTAAIYFDDARVPVENLIGEENAGFMHVMKNFNSERIGMAASCIGASKACLEDAITWAQERQTFGKRLIDHQVIRHKIAEMARHIKATQSFLELSIWRIEQGEVRVDDLSLLKVQATRTMEFCAREASQILGGASYLRGSRVERIYREVRVNAIGGGSEEIMLDLAARQMRL